MALLNFWSQKNFLGLLGSDVSGLKTYIGALNQCAHFLHACWDGNSDKMYLFMALKKQIDEVNKQRQDVNWVQQVATFVLERINDLGNLDGCSQPYVTQVPNEGMTTNCAAQTKIKLDTGKLRDAADYLKGYRSCLESSKNNLVRATNVIDIFILGMWTIGAKIAIANNQIDALLARHDKIIAALYQIAVEYDNHDRYLNQKGHALSSPDLLRATTPYAFVTPEVRKLIEKYAKEIYDKIKDWFAGKEVKKDDKEPIVVILNRDKRDPKGSQIKDDGKSVGVAGATATAGGVAAGATNTGEATTKNPDVAISGGTGPSGGMKPYTDNPKYAGFSVVGGFSSAYLYNQNDYSKFISDGKNQGCTSTAEAIAYSIHHQQTRTPDTMAWGAGGALWHDSTYLKVGDKTYNKGTYTVQDAYDAMYHSVSAGMPVIFRVTGHELVAIGIKDGATPPLSPADILVADPYDGAVKTLGGYFSDNPSKKLDTTWSMFVST